MPKLIQLLDNLTGRPNAMRELAGEAKEEFDQVIATLEWYAERVRKLNMFYNGPGLYHGNRESLEVHKDLERDGGKLAQGMVDLIVGR